MTYSKKADENFLKYITNPDHLFSLIKDKLQNHKQKTYRYANVAYKNAAVIIPIFFKDQEAHLLFTKRTDNVEHHKGQISFPGGMHDAGDEDLEATACRETWEEMGIQTTDLTILGYTDKFLTNTNFMVTPYVAYFPYPYPYKINKDEIAKVLEVPLRHLLNPNKFRIEKWERDGIVWNVHYYDYHNEKIWGVTGFLLSNFLSIVFDLSRMDNRYVT